MRSQGFDLDPFGRRVGRAATDELVGTSAAAEILGVRPGSLAQLELEGRLPAPVAWIEGRRAWLRQDINRASHGRRAPERHPGEMQEMVLNSAETAGLLGIGDRHLRRCVQDRRWDLVPQPAGRIGLALYWWRDEVEGFPGRDRHEIRDLAST